MPTNKVNGIKRSNRRILDNASKARPDRVDGEAAIRTGALTGIQKFAGYPEGGKSNMSIIKNAFYADANKKLSKKKPIGVK